jgi:FkbM family methyltransferase|tara:strand:+ start:153 stop:893 length:741 start_codon:yes stop_codon:yes gene_type:complete
MKTFSDFSKCACKGIQFIHRKGTSDLQAVEEVVAKNSYERKRVLGFPGLKFEIEAGETWIDIGGNIGAFALLAASKGAEVFSFEPDPENYAMLCHNLKINAFGKKVSAFEHGLYSGQESKTLNFYRNSNNGKLWRNGFYKKWRNGECIAARLEPVENYWNENNCVKLDAEGAEMEILESYAKRPVKKLVFEWSFDVDSSIERFMNVINELRKVYKHVLNAKVDESVSHWKPEWFPPAKTIWCFNEN